MKEPKIEDFTIIDKITKIELINETEFEHEKKKYMKILFEEQNNVEDHYIGMPEYNNIKVEEPFIKATFKFRNQEDFDFFNNFLKEHLYKEVKIFDGMQRKTVKSTWYPLNEKASKYLYEDEE